MRPRFGSHRYSHAFLLSRGKYAVLRPGAGSVSRAPALNPVALGASAQSRRDASATPARAARTGTLQRAPWKACTHYAWLAPIGVCARGSDPNHAGGRRETASCASAKDASRKPRSPLDGADADLTFIDAFTCWSRAVTRHRQTRVYRMLEFTNSSDQLRTDQS